MKTGCTIHHRWRTRERKINKVQSILHSPPSHRSGVVLAHVWVASHGDIKIRGWGTCTPAEYMKHVGKAVLRWKRRNMGHCVARMRRAACRRTGEEEKDWRSPCLLRHAPMWFAHAPMWFLHTPMVVCTAHACDMHACTHEPACNNLKYDLHVNPFPGRRRTLFRLSMANNQSLMLKVSCTLNLTQTSTCSDPSMGGAVWSALHARKRNPQSALRPCSVHAAMRPGAMARACAVRCPPVTQPSHGSAHMGMHVVRAPRMCHSGQAGNV